MTSAPFRRRAVLAGLAAAPLAACGDEKPKPPPPKLDLPTPPLGSLEWAAAGPWRLDPERDAWRHPVETLKFFGIRANMSVIEVLPGRGWYTAILAPFLAQGGGALTVATFDRTQATEAQLTALKGFEARFLSDPKLYGAITMSAIGPKVAAIAPDGSADLAIVMRNIHTFMAEGYLEVALKLIFRALKPGGVLGVEEHRARSTGLQDPRAATGYVQEAFVRSIAQDVGFEFGGSSEINANPKDTKDHPFGVWTLPPVLRTAPLGMAPNPDFDSRPYAAIGESDRMTLKFIKPGAAPKS
ncbi:MAG: methyltransferase [Alphaproteobacteria bacterium]|nr:methyltransferase [Alphaproteobacteria bacterium]